MSKKKPAEQPDNEEITTVEDIERFVKTLEYFAERCRVVLQRMRKNDLPSLNRKSKRSEKIRVALSEYTNGLQGVLNKVAIDIEDSDTTQLKVADIRSTYESSSEKKDKK